MACRTFDLLGQVHPAHAFDFDALFRYSCANVDGFPASPSTFTVLQVSSASPHPYGNIRFFFLPLFWFWFDYAILTQFGHGQSNPTFLMEVGGGGSVNRYVVRKKPSGKLLPSAHAVEREYQVESVNHVWLLRKCR